MSAPAMPGNARLENTQVGWVQGQGAHPGDEGRVAGGLHVAQREQPFQGIVLGRQKAVEAGRGEVWGFHGRMVDTPP